jgi:uncharacterized protein (TIGR02246 family)
MTSEADIHRASALLSQLQSAATAQDLAGMLDLFTEDAVVLGTSAANLDRRELTAYVTALFELPHCIHWDFEMIRVVDSRVGALTFVALGTVGLDGPDESRDQFRLTCLAVDDGDRWRLRHFHGSIRDL